MSLFEVYINSYYYYICETLSYNKICNIINKFHHDVLCICLWSKCYSIEFISMLNKG